MQDKGKFDIEKLRRENKIKNSQVLKDLISDHVYKAKIMHQQEHPYFSTGQPKANKYDLKDTFFREKWATKPLTKQEIEL